MLGFTINPQTGDINSGTWGFSNDNYQGPIALELKAGNFLSYYFFEDITGGFDGLWNTIGVAKAQEGNGDPLGLSHASLFYVEDGFTPPPGPAVPEPMTILGTGMALGLGTLFQKQRSKQKKQGLKA